MEEEAARSRRQGTLRWRKIASLTVSTFALATATIESIREAEMVLNGLHANLESEMVAPTRSRKGKKRSLRRSQDETMLPFGMEIEFLFPEDIKVKSRYATNPRLQFDVLFQRTTKTQEIHSALEKAGVPNTMFLFKDKTTPVHDSWKLVAERAGFELVSPLNPSLHTVATAINVMKDLGVRTDPINTVLHVSIDTRGKNIDQIRNAYKNFIVVEPALDEIREVQHRANRTEKSMSIAMVFPSVENAFSQLDACQDIRCLKETCQPFGYTHLMGLRNNLKVTQMLQDQGLVTDELFPLRFEFKGQKSTNDPDFVVNWIRLVNKLMQTSYHGEVLDGRERTVDQAWVALFDELLRDKKLRCFFDKERRRIKQQVSSIENDSEDSVDEELSAVYNELLQDDKVRAFLDKRMKQGSERIDRNEEALLALLDEMIRDDKLRALSEQRPSRDQ